jgi:L-ascorbate 6-phosphate lactonase
MSATAASELDRLAALTAGASSVGMLWLGQSGVALRLAGRTVLIDPFLSPHPDRLVPPPFAAADAHGVDLVLVTHDHLDHLDEDALPVLAAASPTATVVVPTELVERVAHLGVERKRIAGVDAPGTVELGGLTIHGVPACHGEKPSDAYRLGPFRGYVVAAPGLRVYHAGDTIPFDGLVERLRGIGVDLALLPINGRDAEREALGIVGNLDAREAAELAAAIDASAVVPLHWDMFAANLGDPARLVRAAETTVIVPRRLDPFVYSCSREQS